MNRGNIYFKQKDFIQAVADFTKAIEQNPRMAVAFNNRGVSYIKLKEYKKAWSDLLKAKAQGYKVNPDFIAGLKQAMGK